MTRTMLHFINRKLKTVGRTLKEFKIIYKKTLGEIEQKKVFFLIPIVVIDEQLGARGIFEQRYLELIKETFHTNFEAVRTSSLKGMDELNEQFENVMENLVALRKTLEFNHLDETKDNFLSLHLIIKEEVNHIISTLNNNVNMEFNQLGIGLLRERERITELISFLKTDINTWWQLTIKNAKNTITHLKTLPLVEILLMKYKGPFTYLQKNDSSVFTIRDELFNTLGKAVIPNHVVNQMSQTRVTEQDPMTFIAVTRSKQKNFREKYMIEI